MSEYQPAIAKAGCGECRPCKYRRKRAWERANREKVNAARNRHRRENHARALETARKWREANPDKVKSYNLKKGYGITIEHYNEMLTQQDGCCAICGAPENKDGRKLYVDHCHGTGVVRGLLCHKCNSGIGAFRDSPALVEKALSYLLEGKL